MQMHTAPEDRNENEHHDRTADHSKDELEDRHDLLMDFLPEAASLCAERR
jgi:hypothetical protein